MFHRQTQPWQEQRPTNVRSYPFTLRLEPGLGRGLLREKSMDSPRIRATSCGAWNPVEFSASTKPDSRALR